ncbi:phosphatidate cytidylyltransferase [Chitinophaga oryzae]|uniref:Phosphatidate cytidylyltransferase n=1 Tax=Chitinophaga oryzae TaxID=2725414 RepID=A0AAE7D5R3_9BACT|nr:phosphatidate cytidylyltransferase [Chitinophaga oryzae]QJB30495.1 phosphatidate cytidylyltransferase [Chitinophaga oryzae]QJB36993.1 phosphatidate cytidylyltransferase [Chitinophaga oryzae]
MKKLSYLLLVMIAISMASCEVVGGIFKAGVWTGIFIVALVVGLIIYFITRGSRRD